MNDKGRIQALGARLRGRRAGRAPFLLGVAIVGLFSWTLSLPAATLPMVTIGKSVDILPFTPVDEALAQGYFKQNGVDVKEEAVDGSSAANAAMVGGSLQFSCVGADPLMLARTHGLPIISIAAFNNSVTLQLVVSEKWLAKHPVSAAATFTQKMGDLNGAVLAEVGTTEQTYYGLLRGWAGLPKLTGYRVERIASQTAIALAIQRGLVDVALLSPPISVQIAQQGYAKLLVDQRDIPQFNNIAFDILTTTSSYAKQNPKITRAVATAIAQGADFMRSHPDQALAFEQRHFPKLSKSVLQESLKLTSFAKNGMQSQKEWNNAVNLAQQTGVVRGITGAPEGVYWTNEYIDTSKLVP